MYEYRALVKRVYDGDTITVDIDLGFNIIMRNQKIRLLGIDTPEIRGSQRPEGLLAKTALENRVLNEWITLKTKKDKKGKYGRWLGEILLLEENVNDWMIKEGYAKKYPE